MKELNAAVKAGKAVVGSKKAMQILLNSEPKLVVVASNCPQMEKEALIYYSRLAGVQVKEVKENSTDLGSICGKPFKVSAACIIE